jgi:hypothetical protein
VEKGERERERARVLRLREHPEGPQSCQWDARRRLLFLQEQIKFIIIWGLAEVALDTYFGLWTYNAGSAGVVEGTWHPTCEWGVGFWW